MTEITDCDEVPSIDDLYKLTNEQWAILPKWAQRRWLLIRFELPAFSKPSIQSEYGLMFELAEQELELEQLQGQLERTKKMLSDSRDLIIVLTVQEVEKEQEHEALRAQLLKAHLEPGACCVSWSKHGEPVDGESPRERFSDAGVGFCTGD